MPRHVYISCDFSERELEQVKALCSFLQSSDCLIRFAPEPKWSFYPIVEEAIERCDTFIAAVGVGYSCSTWLAHEVTYALALQRARMHPRPRVFALRLNNYDKPIFVDKLSVEWLQQDDYYLLLENLPEQG